MRWEDIKKTYPNQWVLIEAIDAETKDSRRILNKMAIVDNFKDNNTKALQEYVQLHKIYPNRELYVVHTSRYKLDIKERRWTGVRGSC